MTTGDPAGDFARVREVLHGTAAPLARTSSVTKILRVLFTGDTDAEISPRGFEVRFVGGRSIPYVTRFTPAAIQALLSSAAICPEGQAVSFRLEDRDADALVGFHDAARWVWILPGDDVVFVYMRAPTSPGPPPSEPTPLPEPPARPKKLFAHVRQSFACPHCQRVATVYRAALDGWICLGPRCGRSFTPPHRVRTDAELREDAGEAVRETGPRAKIYR